MNLPARLLLLTLMSLLAPNDILAGAPHGLDLPRLENTELIIDELPSDSVDPMTVTRVYPRIEIPRVTFLQEAPWGGRIFAGCQEGQIYTFPDIADPDPITDVELFLDLNTCFLGEQGLVSLAFDPDYLTNGEFYVFYTEGSAACTGINPGFPSRLSRFTNDDPSQFVVNPASEEVLIQLSKPYAFHLGGDMRFGPDGMLYVSIGDGGSEDGRLWAQDTASLYGSILRLDVSNRTAGQLYSIPTDNPFFNGGPSSGFTRKEIFAYGFRNPWRISFDSINGYLYVSDVGYNDWEEINIVRPGENYGWGLFEGMDCSGIGDCSTDGFTFPAIALAHGEGTSAIMGGGVYSGSLHPSLYGRYIFANIYRGEVYALNFDGRRTISAELLVESPGRRWTAYCQTSDGRVLLGEHGFGAPKGIYELVPVSAPTPSEFPLKLSDLPALLEAGSGGGHNVDGVYIYEPAAKLWSDGAEKERYLALPGLDQAHLTPYGGWDMPEGTIVVKNFILPRDERSPVLSLQRIETRLLIRKDGEWHGFTYEWNEDETDAVLLTGFKERELPYINSEGVMEDYHWYYPSRADCLNCHTDASNHLLGVSTPQLNHWFTYPTSGVEDNQISALDWISIFDEPAGDPARLPTMVDYGDTNESLARRARAYLASNCSNCHQPGGPTGRNIDLRYEIPIEDMNAVSVIPQEDFGIKDAAIISPGQPDHSTLLYRMSSTTEGHRMPPLATSRVDEEGVEIIRQWIQSLELTNTNSGWDLYR